MKKIIVALVAVLMLFSVVACSSGKTEYNFNLTEYITVPEYKGIEIKTADIKSNYETEKAKLIENASTDEEITEETVKDDKITAKVTATVEGEEITKGTDTATALLIGDEVSVTVGGSYFGIEEFDAMFTGKKKGDEFTFTYTFPEDYSKEVLRGKEAIYSVSVTKATRKKVPEFTDALVAEKTKCKTIDEYEKYTNREYVRSTAWNKVMDETEVIKYPMDIVKRYYTNSYKYYDSYAAAYGYTLSNLVTSNFGMSLEAFLDELIDSAKRQVLQEMVYTQISKNENIVVDEEYYESHIEDFAVQSGYEGREALEEAQSKDTIMSSLLYDKVIDFIADSATITD